jgi:uncharacterized Zn finger protein
MLMLAAAAASVPDRASSPEAFAPRGWTVLEKAMGDLNQDGVPDAAIIFKDPKEEKEGEFDVERVLVIALQQPGKGWARSAVSEEEVLCRSCGGVFGDPFAALKIERGAVVVVHYGGSRDRWGYTHRYRLENGEWVRIGETEVSEDALEGNGHEVDRNLVTGRVVEKTTRNHKATSKTYREIRPMTARPANAPVSAVLSGDTLTIYSPEKVQLRTDKGKVFSPSSESAGEARFSVKALGWTDRQQQMRFWITPELSLLFSPEGERPKLK